MQLVSHYKTSLCFVMHSSDLPIKGLTHDRESQCSVAVSAATSLTLTPFANFNRIIHITSTNLSLLSTVSIPSNTAIRALHVRGRQTSLYGHICHWSHTRNSQHLLHTSLNPFQRFLLFNTSCQHKPSITQ